MASQPALTSITTRTDAVGLSNRQRDRCQDGSPLESNPTYSCLKQRYRISGVERVRTEVRLIHQSPLGTAQDRVPSKARNRHSPHLFRCSDAETSPGAALWPAVIPRRNPVQ